MLLKPSPRAPFCSLLLGEVLLEAGMPPGQVNVIPCENEFVGRMLDDARVKMLSFTGSAAVGWDLKARARKQRVALELGGNAAAIIHRDAHWRDRLPALANSAFGYAGNRASACSDCTSTARFTPSSRTRLSNT